ncbi:MAG: T9SS type A sorting domain-containing protein, partial [Bacteroidales bacterium]|nr:T9SS type A sorting domain-containing protein [Bacteroidales bacterium]
DLTFVMSTNCRTGNFIFGEDDNDCFAERFMRTDKGCVAIIAASETSFSYVNDTYVLGCYDYLWNDFLPYYGDNDTHFKYPAFANVYGKYFLEQSSWPELSFNKNVTYNLFHYFGDAFLKLNTEMPKRINISYPTEITSEDTYIKIKRDKDTKIALSVEGKIIAISSDNDSILTIHPQESGSKIKVVATKQDHYRHEGFIEVQSILDYDDIFIYPNPANDILFVESKGINKIEIYNSIGQKLMEINNSSSREKVVIDCSTLKKGLFHLHIIYEDKRVGKSFVRL